MPGPLDNAKHERFAQLRAKGLTADQAYIQAGYNAHTGNAHRLSVNERVCSRVKEILGAVETRTVVTKARVIEELAKMGFANMLDYMQLHDDGTAAVDFSRLSRDQAAAIQRSSSSWTAAAKAPVPSARSNSSSPTRRPLSLRSPA